MVPPPTMMTSNFVPDGGAVSSPRSCSPETGLSAIGFPPFDMLGLNTAQGRRLEASRAHRLNCTERAFHPALVERTGLAADEQPPGRIEAGHPGADERDVGTAGKARPRQRWHRLPPVRCRSASRLRLSGRKISMFLGRPLERRREVAFPWEC